MTLFTHELRLNLKTLLVWSACVGITCFGCIWLFGGLRDSMEQMAQAYAEMGAFSTALGLDRISVSTMDGFYATEVALIFAMGGAMYAAMTGACMLSREEEGHTSEFLNTLPVGRGRIVMEKYLSMAALILLFSVLCILQELAGFALTGAMAHGDVPKELVQGAKAVGEQRAGAEIFSEDFARSFLLFHGAQLLMHLEVGSLCFLVSALCRKKQVGAALGFTVLLYVMDLMCRIVPDIEKLKYITPFYFASATDIFTAGGIETAPAGMGLLATAAATALALAVYCRRDLAA